MFAADLVAQASEIGVGVDGNDLLGYQKDALVVHKPVWGVSVEVVLSPRDDLVADRSTVAHAESLEAAADAGDSGNLNLVYGSSVVADGKSISAVVLVLDRLERDAPGIRLFYLDLISVAMTGPPELSAERYSPLS